MARSPFSWMMPAMWTTPSSVITSYSIHYTKLYDCSRFCCMYMIKQARLIKEKYPNVVINMHFIDVRAFGKGYEEYYTGARAMGINFFKGKVGGLEMLPDA